MTLGDVVCGYMLLYVSVVCCVNCVELYDTMLIFVVMCGVVWNCVALPVVVCCCVVVCICVFYVRLFGVVLRCVGL